MSWVSRKRRFGSYLALAGLALQLILSFGHLHLDGMSRGSAVVTVTAAIVLGSQSPAHHPANDADDYCAICATIHLAANSFVPQAPQVPALFASRPIEHFDLVAAVFVPPQQAFFQSRAPPLA